MSFGRPGNASISFSATAPERGSFPLDHEGECKSFMIRYLECMKESKQTSTACRGLSKQYLECRMQRGLMEKVKWEDLGFHGDEQGAEAKVVGETAGAQPTKRSTHGPPPTTTLQGEGTETGTGIGRQV
ncbi:BQ5605_C023g09617 [Microbotryum silenes-dioicae]|uniref:BQ5605_C023g09617 protein n=1 Tax=Microbotryum silenes-dioicae TaxID=796604 RepID=A0A2X0NDT6_9BASI|nr:BQ5605_C023g09617 [Microbotryum silenes-dioicae]